MSFPFVIRTSKQYDYDNTATVQNSFLKKQQVLKTLGGISATTLSRLVKENGFPAPEKLGNRLYFKTSSIFEWISLEAGRKVVAGDELLSSKQLEALFSRSTTWIWYAFQKTARKELAVKIRSRPHWLKSEVFSDSELRKYLEVVNGIELGGVE